MWRGFLSLFQPSTRRPPAPRRRRVHPLGDGLHVGATGPPRSSPASLWVSPSRSSACPSRCSSVSSWRWSTCSRSWAHHRRLPRGRDCRHPLGPGRDHHADRLHRLPAGREPHPESGHHEQGRCSSTRSGSSSPYWSGPPGGRVAGGLGTFVGALVGIPVGGAIQVMCVSCAAGPTPSGILADEESSPAVDPVDI